MDDPGDGEDNPRFWWAGADHANYTSLSTDITNAFNQITQETISETMTSQFGLGIHASVIREDNGPRGGGHLTFDESAVHFTRAQRTTTDWRGPDRGQGKYSREQYKRCVQKADITQYFFAAPCHQTRLYSSIYIFRFPFSCHYFDERVLLNLQEKRGHYNFALGEAPTCSGAASWPPSTGRIAPVTHAPAFDDKYKTAPAMSSARPHRRSGMLSCTSSASAYVASCADMSVGT